MRVPLGIAAPTGLRPDNNEEITVTPKPTPKKPDMSVLLKTLLDLGPLAAFMIADQVVDIFIATGVLMIAVVIAFIASWIMARRIALIPLVTLGFILIFGALTLLFDDETFIKVEVTITYGLSGLFLLGGLALGSVFTLFVIPALFSLTYGTRERVLNAFSRRLEEE